MSFINGSSRQSDQTLQMNCISLFLKNHRFIHTSIVIVPNQVSPKCIALLVKSLFVPSRSHCPLIYTIESDDGRYIRITSMSHVRCGYVERCAEYDACRTWLSISFWAKLLSGFHFPSTLKNSIRFLNLTCIHFFKYVGYFFLCVEKDLFNKLNNFILSGSNHQCNCQQQTCKHYFIAESKIIRQAWSELL